MRGPKLKTAKNTSKSTPGLIRHEAIIPTSTLTPGALHEFQRLCTVLDSRDTLDRIDLSVITECARVADQIDQLYRLLDPELPDSKTLKLISILTTHHRGFLREMGLTMQVSRSIVRTNAKIPQIKTETIGSKIKLGA